MPHDARAIGNLFIKTAWREQYPLTHLALQKILFFAHAWHLAKYNSPLIGQKFEAWKYGPVVRVVYDQLKNSKSAPIEQLLQKLDTRTGEWIDALYSLEGEEHTFLIDIFQYYSRFHAGKLVDLTHTKDGPWDNIWNKAVDSAVPGMIIPDEEIKVWILRAGGHGDSRPH